MKSRVIRTEIELAEALPRVLGKGLFRVTHAEYLTPYRPPNPVVRLDYATHHATFAAECLLHPSVAAIEQLAAGTRARKRPLLVTVRLTDFMVEQCRKHGVPCLDLNGRVWVSIPGLLIDRATLPAGPRYRLAQPEIRFFSSKSARLPRALLHGPARTWRQCDLATATDLSQGLISRLLNHAADQGWVDGKRGNWTVSNAEALLDAWERADDFSIRVTLRQYSTLEPDRRAIAHALVARTAGALAFTQWFAASLRHPYADVPVVTAYRTEFLTSADLRALNCREVMDGGRIWIAVPRDPGVFRHIQRVDDLPLASDAQIYLDLIHAGLRGPDQAKALREWSGFGRP